jgi:hypothetical protein
MIEYTNPKGQKVMEFNLEDWKQGNNPFEPNKSGSQKIILKETGEIYFQLLPYAELEKIRAEQRRIYWESVEGYFKMYCHQFETLFDVSGNKARLLKTEIEKYEYIFFPDKRVNMRLPIGLNMSEFGGFDYWYQQEFVLQNIDFTCIEFNEFPMLINSRGKTKAYARAKYLDWLIKKLSQKSEVKQGDNQDPRPKSFEELFYNPNDAEPCLRILGEIPRPAIDAANNYIGNAKGIFPMWIRVLQNHKPKPLIKPFPDSTYKDLLNQKVYGLKLTNDASEFRKVYKRLEYNKIELDIKTILSQFSQDGKLGKLE